VTKNDQKALSPPTLEISSDIYGHLIWACSWTTVPVLGQSLH